MKSPVTQYDLALVAKARTFVQRMTEHEPSFRAMAVRGFDARALERGRTLLSDAERAFTWEGEGRAWNYISQDPERRVREAQYWYADARRRWKQRCFRDAEAALAKGGVSSWGAAAKCLAQAFSPIAGRALRAEFQQELARARGEKPADAPPPKDTVIVELAGWYERWALAARHMFRQSPEELTILGIAPGKAIARRLRTKHDPLAASGKEHVLHVIAE
jgi:hypothetical protein